MEVQELLEKTRESLTAKRVYAEPYVKNGLTVIPAAVVRGGGGGGAGHDKEGDEGGGGGFGLAARPIGAWIIDGQKVEWKPAVDATRILFGLELIVAAGVLRGVRRRRRVVALPRLEVPGIAALVAHRVRAVRRPRARARLHLPFA